MAFSNGDKAAIGAAVLALIGGAALVGTKRGRATGRKYGSKAAGAFRGARARFGNWRSKRRSRR